MRSSAPQACQIQAFPVLNPSTRYAQCALFPMQRDLRPSPVPVWCSHTRRLMSFRRRSRTGETGFRPSGVPAPQGQSQVAFPHHSRCGGLLKEMPSSSLVRREGENPPNTLNMSWNRRMSHRFGVFWLFSRSCPRRYRPRQVCLVGLNSFINTT